MRVGLDAQIMIALRNVSDRQIMFAHRPGANNPEFSYEIEVKNATGHMVEETAYGREARASVAGGESHGGLCAAGECLDADGTSGEAGGLEPAGSVYGAGVSEGPGVKCQVERIRLRSRCGWLR